MPLFIDTALEPAAGAGAAVAAVARSNGPRAPAA